MRYSRGSGEGEDMKKIGIMTLNGYRNYGNRLQNYALQRFIEKLGYEVETLIYKSIPDNKNTLEKIIAHFQNKDLMDSIGFKLQSIFNSDYKKRNHYFKLREENFKIFTAKYINEAKFSIDSGVMSDKAKKAFLNDRYFSTFVGSDQVWNYEGKAFPDMFFLPFMDRKKRNSFSASFGFSEIPNKSFRFKYAKSLKNMNCISVREKSGQSIIKDLTSKTCDVLLDPTLLLTKNEWLNISASCSLKPHGRKYLLTYFLGEITNDYQQLIDKTSFDNNYEVINLNEISDKVAFSISPSEFIDLVSNASFIITDSFHGTAFSIIFSKPFFVVDRIDKMVNMSTRIINLLEQFHLSQRYLKQYDINKSYFDIDFSFSEKIIENNISSSLNFLNKALQE